MKIASITEPPTVPAIAVVEPLPPVHPELDVLFKAVSVVHALNDLSPANNFSVIRDPGTGIVVIAIRLRATGELIDLCSPEALFGILEHLPGSWKESRE